jgi:hypothetical protein
MSSFDNQIVEVPQSSGWHFLSGTIVLCSGMLAMTWGIAFLVV